VIIEQPPNLSDLFPPEVNSNKALSEEINSATDSFEEDKVIESTQWCKKVMKKQ